MDALGYAFEHCFGYYEGCGVYLELLVERRVRRARGQDVESMMAVAAGGVADVQRAHAPLVQVTVGGRGHRVADDHGGGGAYAVAG